MNLSFGGYSASARNLLRELPGFDRDAFAAEKKRWTTEVLDPTKALVDHLVPMLQEKISPTIVGQAKVNGSISPINNDLRFTPDKDPYKDHLLLTFWDGRSKKTAPILYFRIAADEVGFATGAMFEGPLLDRWRQLIDDEATGAPLVSAIDALAKSRGADVVGSALKRVPKPFDPDHPRGELLRHKSLQVRWPEPAPASIGTDDFAGWLVDRLSVAGDVHRWLRDELYA